MGGRVDDEEDEGEAFQLLYAPLVLLLLLLVLRLPDLLPSNTRDMGCCRGGSPAVVVMIPLEGVCCCGQGANELQGTKRMEMKTWAGRGYRHRQGRLLRGDEDKDAVWVSGSEEMCESRCRGRSEDGAEQTRHACKRVRGATHGELGHAA